MKGVTCFGGGATSVVVPNMQVTIAKANHDGVIRIDQVVSSEVAKKSREHILPVQQ
jgi:hypothetical protein